MTAVESAHSLSEDQFAQLASGFGDAGAVSWLVQAQSSLQRELLAAVGRFGPRSDPRFAAAWDVLVSLDASAPDAVADVLAHPYTRVWAMRLLQGAADSAFAPADVHHLEAVAASAAVRARKDMRLPVPVRDGVAPLPMLGALKAGAVEQVWIETDAVDELAMAQPLRRLTSAGPTVTLEDTDPYRVLPYLGSEIHPTGRLSDAEAQQWQAAFADAIDFIETHLPGYAPGLRAGLCTVLPLRAEGPTDRSASARLAFGAVGIAALRLDPITLAELLVHEFQHVKLGAMMDAFELYDRSDTEPRYHPPCFTHPRPIEGVLHSTYAHLAIADFWRARETLATGSAREAAARRLAEVRGHTAEGLRQLRESGSLTTLGESLVQAMSEAERAG
ncbi:HEXXH motif domain-containing protein [Nocardia sp. NBC_00508]|uniref:HEXXH motif domain-containing protein n=1 Tax=Nocardia sp. NBC_00508 TaxID=2975992 RepID=UPI002E817ED6|nr:HEXXH motif domain-containing protein [Nocardia sp. NBC_00508]WUD69193.1 HEXXH motif domain-containing protein [Nocardia sp. NBC_00508]